MTLGTRFLEMYENMAIDLGGDLEVSSQILDTSISLRGEAFVRAGSMPCSYPINSLTES